MVNEGVLLNLLYASISRVKPVDDRQMLVGGVIVALCVLLFIKEHWFLENTKKGKRLISWFGQKSAPTVLRGLVLMGILFGVLLALGFIRPIQWR